MTPMACETRSVWGATNILSTSATLELEFWCNSYADYTNSHTHTHTHKLNTYQINAQYQTMKAKYLVIATYILITTKTNKILILHDFCFW